MPGESRKSSKAILALAISRGASIAKWARANEVPLTTAFRWARDPIVRKAIESYRRRTLDRAIGRMTENTELAANEIVRVVKEGDSDSVRLRASRAVFSDLITVSKFSVLEARMVEVEEKLVQKTAGAGAKPAYPKATNYGPAVAPPPQSQP